MPLSNVEVYGRGMPVCTVDLHVEGLYLSTVEVYGGDTRVLFD